MDLDEPRGPVDPSAPPLAIETMLGYARFIRTALWYEVGRDRGKVCQECHRSFLSLTLLFQVIFDESGDRG
jgi:hypothetical protein